MNISKILWITPFFSFIAGYYLLHLLYSVPEIKTPCILGKQLPEAVKILSDYNLNARLMAEKEDIDLPNYTIVSQTPATHTKVKPHQSVFLVVTKHPETRPAPHMIGKSAETITQQLNDDHIRYKYYWLTTHHPKETCIAQYPQPKDPIDDNFMILYLSAGNHKPFIWPDFKERELDEVVSFLEHHEYAPEIIYNTNKKSGSYVVDQRPLAGSLVNLHNNSKPLIQLYVE